jgi:hypothetical protein
MMGVIRVSWPDEDGCVVDGSAWFWLVSLRQTRLGRPRRGVEVCLNRGNLNEVCLYLDYTYPATTEKHHSWGRRWQDLHLAWKESLALVGAGVPLWSNPPAPNERLVIIFNRHENTTGWRNSFRISICISPSQSKVVKNSKMLWWNSLLTAYLLWD